jgi:hypothetical protein
MSVGEDLVTRFPASTAELSITTDKLGIPLYVSLFFKVLKLTAKLQS